MNAFPISSPAQEGVDPASLAAFFKHAERENLHLHAFEILRHDKIIAQGAYTPYRLDQNHFFFSMSKSFTAIAIGFAVQEGLLSCSDKVLSFFPEEAPAAPSPYFQALTIYDLLTMRSGHLEEQLHILLGNEWVQQFLRTQLPREPGTFFAYNTVGTYLLSAILQKKAGQTLLEYLTPRLLEPIGCSNTLQWEKSPEGVCAGGFGISGLVDDIARFCTFVLHKGSFQGKQLLDPSWLEQAAQPHADNAAASPLPDWQQGYGYQFWRCVPTHVFRGDGAFGQLGIVLPDQDMVIAIHAGCANDDEIQVLFNLLWADLLPGVDRIPQSQLPEPFMPMDLDLPTYFHNTGCVNSICTGKVYDLAQNPYGFRTVEWTKRPDASTALVLRSTGSYTEIPLNAQQWIEFDWPEGLCADNPQCVSFSSLRGVLPKAAAKACTAGNTLWVDIAFLGTPFQDSWKFIWKDDQLIWRLQRAASFFPADFAISGHVNAIPA